MTPDEAWLAKPHRRYNPLLREWILVSPQRTARPWLGETGDAAVPHVPAYDATCYLCPGNARAGGERNPNYTGTFVFENDFAALVPDTPQGSYEDGVLVARSERGRARVVCYSPRHDLSIASMAPAAVRLVVDAWADETVRLGSETYVRAVTVFENRGDAMGASNRHPHAQIWANETVPNLPAREELGFLDHLDRHGTCLLCTYLARELELGERIVFASDRVVVVVPFWATWPFETLVMPRHHARSLDGLDDADRDGLAGAMVRLTTAYDRLFGVPFPYSMGFHGGPTDGAAHDEWHLHAHYFPPLLRSATVRKYMVGYELLAMPQRDITPESAAERLRAQL